MEGEQPPPRIPRSWRGSGGTATNTAQLIEVSGVVIDAHQPRALTWIIQMFPGDAGGNCEPNPHKDYERAWISAAQQSVRPYGRDDHHRRVGGCRDSDCRSLTETH